VKGATGAAEVALRRAIAVTEARMDTRGVNPG